MSLNKDTIKEFNSLYFIDESGDIFCKATGKIKGCLDKSTGYKKFSFRGKYWYQHRLVYLATYGELPEYGLDHINGNRGDNRPENLRPAKQKYNAINRKRMSTNTTGYVGVQKNPKSYGYSATGQGEGRKRERLGTFTCKKEAALAYNYYTLDKYGHEYPNFNQVFEDHEDTINNEEI